MAQIREIIRQTQNKFLNMFEFRGKNKVGHDFRYFVASRAESDSDLKAVSGENHPDGVTHKSRCGNSADRALRFYKKHLCAHHSRADSRADARRT